MLHKNRSLFCKFPLAKQLTPWASVLLFLLFHTGCSNMGGNNMNGTGSTSELLGAEAKFSSIKDLFEETKNAIAHEDQEKWNQLASQIKKLDDGSKKEFLFFQDDMKNTLFHIAAKKNNHTAFKVLLSLVPKDLFSKLVALHNEAGMNFIEEAVWNDNLRISILIKSKISHNASKIKEILWSDSSKLYDFLNDKIYNNELHNCSAIRIMYDIADRLPSDGFRKIIEDQLKDKQETDEASEAELSAKIKDGLAEIESKKKEIKELEKKLEGKVPKTRRKRG